MTGKIAVFALKAVLVGLIATCVSGFPMAVLLSWGMDQSAKLGAFSGAFYLAALGNFIIGLPIALAVFRFVRGETSLARLITLANISGFALVFLVTALGGFFATIFFGIPVVLSANAYAVAGWFLIVRPEVMSSQKGRAT